MTENVKLILNYLKNNLHHLKVCNFHLKLFLFNIMKKIVIKKNHTT